MIPNNLPADVEVARSIWRVTEYRDGAAYQTQHVEDGWYTEAELRAMVTTDPDLIVGSLSTQQIRLPEWKPGIRHRKIRK